MSSELSQMIKKNLIKYISTINSDLNTNELYDYDMYSLVALYCEVFSVPTDSFYACLTELVKDYKNTNPDECLSDEEIYIVNDAFAPLTQMGAAVLYFEELKKSLNSKITEAKDTFFECIEEVKLETERLNTARTSLEKSEIRSDLSQANIALEKARKHEATLLEQERKNQEYYQKLLSSIETYCTNISENTGLSEEYKLIRNFNEPKPE